MDENGGNEQDHDHADHEDSLAYVMINELIEVMPDSTARHHVIEIIRYNFQIPEDRDRGNEEQQGFPLNHKFLPSEMISMLRELLPVEIRRDQVVALMVHIFDLSEDPDPDHARAKAWRHMRKLRRNGGNLEALLEERRRHLLPDWESEDEEEEESEEEEVEENEDDEMEEESEEILFLPLQRSRSLPNLIRTDSLKRYNRSRSLSPDRKETFTPPELENQIFRAIIQAQSQMEIDMDDEDLFSFMH